jgi:hypothetical protein
MDRTYRWLRSLARLALSFYYEEVEVHGAAQVPSVGPLLILANHQISLVDPLLLAHAVPRQLRFLAKAPLFRILAIAITRLQHRGQDVRASLGIMLGVPVFLAWYTGLAFAALGSARPWLWIPLLMAAPFAGLTAVSRLAAWKRSIRKLLVAGTAFLGRGTGGSTERLRALLRENISRLYERGRAGDAAS